MLGIINEVLQWILLISLVRQALYFKDWIDETRRWLHRAVANLKEENYELRLDLASVTRTVGAGRAEDLDLDGIVAYLVSEVDELRAQVAQMRGDD